MSKGLVFRDTGYNQELVRVRNKILFQVQVQLNCPQGYSYECVILGEMGRNRKSEIHLQSTKKVHKYIWAKFRQAEQSKTVIYDSTRRNITSQRREKNHRTGVDHFAQNTLLEDNFNMQRNLRTFMWTVLNR